MILKLIKASPGRSSVHVNTPLEKKEHNRENLKRLREAFERFIDEEEVEKGGPGSGVSGDNTEPIDMPHSPYTSVGTRKGMLENMAHYEENVPMDSITHAGQEKFVPKKLEKVVNDWDSAKQNPIDLLKVGDEYHIIDGHHRYLAAKKMGEDSIKANVRVKAGKIVKDIYSMSQIVSGTDWELGDGGLSNVGDARSRALDNLSNDPQFYRKKRLIEKSDGINLDLGCGQCREPGYLGVDLYKMDHGTYVTDMELGLPEFEDGSCDNIRMSNVPEVDPHTMMKTVERLLAPGGVFVYDGPTQIENQPPHLKQLSNETIDKAKEVGKWTRQKFRKAAVPDAATSNDADPRLGVEQYDQLPDDTLLAVDATSYNNSDAASSERGNRLHGYASQGALIDNTGAVSKIFKADNWKQIIYCVVLSPEEMDLQDDIMSAEDIEKTAHDYLLNARVVGAGHSRPMDAGVVESYIAPVDFSSDGQYGPQTVKKGSWVIGIRVDDPREWQKVLSGEYTGVSIGGSGHRIPV